MTDTPDWSMLHVMEIVLPEHTRAVRVRSNTDDVNIASEVVSNAFYRAARALLFDDSVVVDVGAHIGLFSLCAATRGARVVALEPVPGNFRLLSDNIELNNLQSRIKGYQTALWSTSGVRSMQVAHDSTGGSGFWYHQSSQPPINVPCLRLDELMAAERIEYCHLLKLDCEGAEFEILSTLLPAAWERIGAVLLEYHLWAGYALNQLQKLLEAKGFLISLGASSDPSCGFIHAVRVPERLPALKALVPTELDSPLTRLPLLGSFWRVLRRPAHRLVVYYLNEMIARQNRQNEQFSVYLSVMAAHLRRGRTDT